MLGLILVAAAFGLVNADITGQTPGAGACLCLDFDSVNVRRPACGNVIGHTGYGYCYVHTGLIELCVLSGENVEEFQVEFEGANAFIDSHFLVIGVNNECSCNATRIDNDTGRVTSPNWPQQYPVDFTCTHVQPLPQGEVLDISFTPPFFLENTYDTLTITVSSALSGRNTQKVYTGSGTPPNSSYFPSSTDDMFTLQFVSDFSITGTGFCLDYRIAPCTGAHTTPTGTVSSPGYPADYPAYATCHYTIEQPGPGNIDIAFQKPFWLETGDTLTIHTSAATCGADMDYVFTGSLSPAPLNFTSCSFVDVFLVSTATIGRSGFAFDYAWVSNLFV